MNSNPIKVLAFILPLASCCQEPATDGNVTGEQSAFSDKTLIAEGLRSEAMIVFPEDDERWMGKVDQEKLVNIVFDAIYEGRVTPYDFVTGDALGIEKIKAIESSIDTIYTEDIVTGEVEMKIVEDGLRRDEITKVFLKEDWYFDEVHFRMEKKVTGISLAIENYDEKGNVRGYEPLFTVYFDDAFSLRDKDIP